MDQTPQTNPEESKALTPEILPPLSPEEVIGNAIKQFNETEATDAKIAEIKQIAETLTIAGVDDKAGYKKVDTARKRVKAIRIAVGHKEKELLELPKNYTAKIKGEAARLIAALKPIEDDLQLKQKAIDDVLAEQKRKADEAKAAEARKIAAREQRLYGLGALRDGEGNFVLREWKVTPDQVKTTEEAEFNTLIEAIEQTTPKPAEPDPVPAPSESLPAIEPAQATESAPAPAPLPGINIPKRNPIPAATAPAQAPITGAAGVAQPQGVNLQYAAGFEAAKRKAIETLQDPEKRTRQEFINIINNLKP